MTNMSRLRQRTRLTLKSPHNRIESTPPCQISDRRPPPEQSLSRWRRSWRLANFAPKEFQNVPGTLQIYYRNPIACNSPVRASRDIAQERHFVTTVKGSTAQSFSNPVQAEPVRTGLSFSNGTCHCRPPPQALLEPATSLLPPARRNDSSGTLMLDLTLCPTIQALLGGRTLRQAPEYVVLHLPKLQ